MRHPVRYLSVNEPGSFHYTTEVQHGFHSLARTWKHGGGQWNGEGAEFLLGQVTLVFCRRTCCRGLSILKQQYVKRINPWGCQFNMHSTLFTQDIMQHRLCTILYLYKILCNKDFEDGFEGFKCRHSSTIQYKCSTIMIYTTPTNMQWQTQAT